MNVRTAISLLIAAAFAAIIVVWYCGPVSEPPVDKASRRLHQIIFHPAEIPADLPRLIPVDPDQNSKLASWLRPGERHVDVWKNYIDNNKGGWRLAVRHWVEDGEFQITSYYYANGWMANLESGSQALWIGYCDARKQIEQIEGIVSDPYDPNDFSYVVPASEFEIGR